MVVPIFVSRRSDEVVRVRHTLSHTMCVCLPLSVYNIYLATKNLTNSTNNNNNNNKTGTLRVKIFRRQAKLDLTTRTKDMTKKIKDEDDDDDKVPPLKLPKKTQVYVEQVQRERESAADMHHIFQRDLAGLRMKSAQSYVKLIKVHGPSLASSQSNAGLQSDISVRLDAEIRGLGPQFHLLVHVISNTTTTTTLRNSLLSFSFDHILYHMPRTSIRIPVLIPGITYKYKFVVRSIDRNGAAGKIGIHLYPQGLSLPAISADVTMPLSEVFVEDEEGG